MEMTADAIPQGDVKTVEEEKGWLTREEKTAIIEELEEFQAVGGGSLEDFALLKHMSQATLHRYRKQIRGKQPAGGVRGPRGKNSDRVAKFNEVEALIAGGMGIKQACDQVGFRYPQWHYYKYKKPKKSIAKKYAPRAVKPMLAIAVTDDSYNKTLRARIIVLERLVVELSLDKQALLEAREGAI